MAGIFPKQVEEILAAIEKPLIYITGNDWTNLSRVVDLERTLLPSVARLKELLPARIGVLKRMEVEISGYDSLSEIKKRRRVTNLLALLKEIQALTDGEIREAFGALETNVQWVKGVGPAIAKKLERIGIQTVEDVLYALPRDYEDRREIAKISDIEVGAKKNVVATVILTGRAGRYGKNFEAHLQDGSGILVAKWFQGTVWIEKKIKQGDRVLVYGEVRRWRNRKEMHHPELTVLENDEDPVAGILPVYHATEGITQNKLRDIAARVVDNYTDKAPDCVPHSMARRLGLMELDEAFRGVHQPEEKTDITKLREKTSAEYRRLVFNEFFVLQVGLALKRHGALKDPAWTIDTRGDLPRAIAKALPFDLTEAQKKVIRRIRDEIKKPHPMNILLQGDVGSGKTLVAVLGALFAVEAGHQAAIMAPTEILAEQHYRNISAMLEPEGVKVISLVGKLKEKEKRSVRETLSAGESCIVVGTHAVISEPVNFDKLAYAVVDEQHRFGVYQRMSLKAKGGERVPHTLVMTATPIPRTLAMTVYGDLDLAVLDEMPPGRKPVKTRVISERRSAKMWEEVRGELRAGRQVFVVYPLVEESDRSELLDATGRAEYLAKEVFPEFNVGLVHGRMKSDDKDKVMLDFAAGEVQLLVATTVVEVGIDVPGATVMVVEHAERFGLSQLHQLRGRVGRGDHPGKCFLVARYPMSEEARKRLKIMTETGDGFRIAEEDLELRGPGEFLGARQSGMPDFRVANIARDGQVLIDAKDEAARLVEEDFRLEDPRHRVLKHTLRRLWRGRLALAGVG